MSGTVLFGTSLLLLALSSLSSGTPDLSAPYAVLKPFRRAIAWRAELLRRVGAEASDPSR